MDLRVIHLFSFVPVGMVFIFCPLFVKFCKFMNCNHISQSKPIIIRLEKQNVESIILESISQKLRASF